MTRKFIRFWKGVWAVVKSMGNWKGVLSLLITWLLISGSGVSLISASKNKAKKFAVRNALKNFEESVTFVKSLLDNKSYIPNKYYPATIKDGISRKERTIYITKNI